MRHLLLTLLLVLSALPVAAGELTLPGAATATADPGDPTGLIASDNVELLTTLPNPGMVGARFRDGLMYTTALTGVTIYDVATDPAAPVEVGRLPLPHFQNEDVDLGGDILLVSNDAAESTGILWIIDISDPTSPTLRSRVDMGGSPLGGPGHTASCVLECAFALVTDTGGYRVIDLRDPDAPQTLGTVTSPAGGDIGVTHDIQVDPDGLVWAVGYGGTVAYEIPEDPDVLATMVTAQGRFGTIVTDNTEVAGSRYIEHLGTGDTEYNDYIHHNSWRQANSDLVHVTEEDYTRPGCRGAGAFQVWQAPSTVDEDTGVRTLTPGSQMTLLDAWVPELLADVAAPAALCSAHYFDVRDDGMVAQGWYQQGLRVLDTSDPTDIRQVAFWAPPNALTWSAYWSPDADDIAYVLDASHGIDVLRIDVEAGDDAVVAPVRDAWRTGAGSTTFASPLWGRACSLLPTGLLGRAS